MEEQILQILIEVSKGDKQPEVAQKELLELFNSIQQTFAVVRWFDNEYSDIVCINKEVAQVWADKYNELSGWGGCYVDEEYSIKLSEA